MLAARRRATSAPARHATRQPARRRAARALHPPRRAGSSIRNPAQPVDYRPGKRWRLAPRRQSRRWARLAPPKLREQGRRPTPRCQRRQQRRPRCGPTNVFGVGALFVFCAQSYADGHCAIRRCLRRSASAPCTGYSACCCCPSAGSSSGTSAAQRSALSQLTQCAPSSPFLFHPSAPLATSVVPVIKVC